VQLSLRPRFLAILGRLLEKDCPGLEDIQWPQVLPAIGEGGRGEGRGGAGGGGGGDRSVGGETEGTPRMLPYSTISDLAADTRGHPGSIPGDVNILVPVMKVGGDVAGRGGGGGAGIGSRAMDA